MSQLVPDRVRSQDAQRTNILEGARRAFARKGQAATMADVAQAAGVSQGLAYRYFASKEQLVNELVAHALEQAALAGEVRILNKRIIAEPHKRRPVDASSGPARLIDLSHTIVDGLRTYKGLPAPNHGCTLRACA